MALGDTGKPLEERAAAKVELRAELGQLEAMIEELKIEFEQFFLGFTPHAPDRLHNEVKRKIRFLFNAPFKNSEIAYRLKMLEQRYRSYFTYWQRTNREREAGTYSRDVFKANLKDKRALEDARAETAKGKAKSSFQSLYNSYKSTLENQTGRKQEVDFDAFKKSLVKRAKEHQKKNGNKKVTFKVVVKEGKVSVQTKSK